jgi:peptide/nickel transport system permease protein
MTSRQAAPVASATRTRSLAIAEGIGAFPRHVRRNTGFIVSVAVIVLLLAWAFLPFVFTGYDPIDGVPADKLQAPSLAHWFGTDYLGRDLLARVIYGSSETLKATMLAVLLAMVVGSLIGLTAGSLGGWVDDVCMRIMDVLLAFPSLLLSLTIVTALGFGTINVAIAVGIASVAAFARIMRAEVLKVRNLDFVEAATVSGARWGAVMRRHILPNAAGPVLSLTALEFGTAVLAVSALSFLGFGVAPPQPEWGVLVSEGRNYLASAWWLTTLPGLVIVLVVLAANRISKGFSMKRRSAR